jgi:hypothetical protein
MDPTGVIPGTLVAVVSLNKWSADFAKDMVDVTAFGDTGHVFVPGLPNVKGTLGGWWEALASRVLFDAAFGTTPVTLKLVPSTLDATTFFTGLAYLDASVETAADGAVSVTGNWAAAGPWTLEPPGT